MTNKKCKKCGNTQFTEATDYIPVKPSKGSFKGAKKYIHFV